MKKSNLPIIFSVVHVVLFLLMCLAINASDDGQAPMNWGIFAFLDFPISLLYFYDWPIFKQSILATIFYPPYFIHGLLGVIWWYLVGVFIVKLINWSRQVARKE